MARLSDTDALTGQALRPACPGEPFGAVRDYVSPENTRYEAQAMPSGNAVGPERLRQATQALGKHYGVAASDN